MPLNNPSNLYSGGVVNLNSNPYLQIALREKAKKQAMDDAMYKHYSELPKRINMAGVRYQDLNDLDGSAGGSINQLVEKRKNYWMANKDKILKGGAEKNEIDRIDQEILSETERSKYIAKLEAQAGEAYFSGKRDFDEDDMAIKDKISKSIFSKEHYKDYDTRKPYGYEDFSPPASAYNSLKEQQYNKATLGNIKPEALLNEKGGKVYTLDERGGKVLYKKGYSPQSIYAAANKAAEVVMSDRTMRKHFKGLFENPDKIKQASEALSKIAGVDVVVDSPEEMAAGLKAFELMNYSEIAEEKDVKGANAFKKKLQDEKLSAMLKRLRITEDGKTRRMFVQGKTKDDTYEIDNVAAELDSNITSKDPELQGNVVDITNYPSSWKDDIFGAEKDQYGRRKNTGIMTDSGRELLRVLDDGSYQGSGEPILKGDIYERTSKRQTPYRKAVGTGKVSFEEKPKNEKQDTPKKRFNLKEWMKEKFGKTN